MYADFILTGTIFTSKEKTPFEGAVAVKGSQIIKVGTKNEICKYINNSTEIYDYPNKLIMPGFGDSHVHLFSGCSGFMEGICRDLSETKSEEDCVEKMIEFSKQHPEQKVIKGAGWFPANWGGAMPSKKSLDKAFPDRPAYMSCADGHTFWLNSKALEDCGITKESTVSFGEIQKDEKGELTGLLFEQEAIKIPRQKMCSMSEEELEKNMGKVFAMLSEFGITSVSEMTIETTLDDSYEHFNVFKKLEKKNQLTARVYLYPSLDSDKSYQTVDALKEQFCSDQLCICGLKQFVDGVASTYTAYLLEPYEDKKDHVGQPIYPDSYYYDNIIAANHAGYGVRLHAIGDGAIRLALDCFEKSSQINNPMDYRNCIEHLEHLAPEDIPRFKELNVVASTQPYHLTLDANEKIERVGIDRSMYEWPHKSLLESGAILSFGTDYPVIDLNPFANIYAAVTRKDDSGKKTGVMNHEEISLADALIAYTYGSAYSNNAETKIGTLEENKYADIIVLDRNLFEIPTEEILDTRVLMTIMNGQIVFNRK